MAGGRGERFWPLSRRGCPKHLVSFLENSTLMELSIGRLEGLISLKDTHIITSRVQEKALREVLRKSSQKSCKCLLSKNILAEPEGRDTAAAIALTARWMQKTHPHGGEVTLALLPADHYIQDSVGFRRTLQKAFELAEETQGLITIGIPPTRAATGYGYLKKGEAQGGAFKVLEFKEKPDEKTAREYLASGKYLWNSGIFVWTLSAIIKALETHAPDIWNILKDIDPSNKNALKKIYPTLRKTPIDIAVMEKAKNVFVIPAGFDWDDVGEWPAWARLQKLSGKTDTSGNALYGQTILHDSSENIVYNNDPKHLVAVLGAENLIIVHTKDATFVAPKEKAQEMKALLKKIGANDELKPFSE